MELDHDSAKRKIEISSHLHDVTLKSNWERKRSTLSKGIQWDEETIAEHDKERGTRQKIDEPPTPYSYYPYEAESDCHHSPSAVQDNSGKEILAELAGEMDYNSDCDFVTGTGGNHDKQNMPALAPSSAEKGRVAVQGTSASVFDNWESLQARLSYQKQLQEKTAAKHIEDTLAIENSRYTAANCSSADKTRHKNGLEGTSHTPPSRGDRLQFSPCHNAENSGSGSGHDVNIAAPEDGESDHFKNKRAAHYNEFKLVQAMRSRQKEEDADEDAKDMKNSIVEEDEEDDY